MAFVGERFGFLTVTEILPSIGPEGKQVANRRCLCDCGNETLVWAASLSSGDTKSCGCYLDRVRGQGGAHRAQEAAESLVGSISGYWIADGLHRNRWGTWFLDVQCTVCGNRGSTPYRQWSKMDDCTRCRSLRAIVDDKVFGRARRYVDPLGYVRLYFHRHDMRGIGSNGEVLEHRLVMERHLGRPLAASEMVHHINGDRSDNHIENLQVCANHLEHTIAHGRDSSRPNRRRRADEPDRWVKCACGRGAEIFAYGAFGHTRRFLQHHHRRGIPVGQRGVAGAIPIAA